VRELRPVDQPVTSATVSTHTIQASYGVRPDVWDRYDKLRKRLLYQGTKPFNGDIVYAALNAARGRYDEIVAARRPQPEPGQLFGAPAPGRRRSADAQHRYQITFRPTPREKEMIHRLKEENGSGLGS